MDISELRIGQRVEQPYSRGPAIVTAIGACRHPGCKFGDECVEVRLVGKAATMNYRARQLGPADEPPIAPEGFAGFAGPTAMERYEAAYHSLGPDDPETIRLMRVAQLAENSAHCPICAAELGECGHS